MRLTCLQFREQLLAFASIGLSLVFAVQTQAQQCGSVTIQPVAYLQVLSSPNAQTAAGPVVAAPFVAVPIGATPTVSTPLVTASNGAIQSPGGPGTEMTQIINRMGLGSDCSRCKALAAQMDQGGPDWVRQNRAYVMQRTISNAENLGHRMGPAKKLGVRRIVNLSVRRSK